VITAKVIWNMKNTLSGTVPGDRVTRDAAEESLVEAADEALRRTAVRERQRVAAGQPQQRDHAGDRETLDQDGQHVLGAHQSRVEQRSPGKVMNSTSAVAVIIQAVSPFARARVAGAGNKRAQQQAERRRHPVVEARIFYPSSAAEGPATRSCARPVRASPFFFGAAPDTRGAGRVNRARCCLYRASCPLPVRMRMTAIDVGDEDSCVADLAGLSRPSGCLTT
jgi:hypothetical protein